MAAIRLAITPGEPAGVGPELLLQLAQQPRHEQWVTIADPDLLQQRADALGLTIKLYEFDEQARFTGDAEGQLAVLPIKQHSASTPGQLNVANSPYVLETLKAAVDGCVAKRFQAMVTGPVHKGIINEAGIPFTGHTEFLAERTQTPRVVMMLATSELRVALVTTHIPLAEVPKAITRELLDEIITILHQDLQQKFGIIDPRILVCGLNPHAGEDGHMGREEIDTIAPALEQLRQDKGIRLTGPLPADTLFAAHHLEQADAALAMYHDQGLPVLKHQGFGRAVNITLGLPIIRTSVDHGTALELAGSGQASSGSFATAIAQAKLMAQATRQGQ